jgi:hypothetical protein
MSPTPDQQAAVERLYENEAIIDNLTSDVAQPLLQWAEQQILAGAASDAVVAAVGAANQSGAQEAMAALAEAQRTLDAAGGAATVDDAPPAEPVRLATHEPGVEGTAQQPARKRRGRFFRWLRRKRA